MATEVFELNSDVTPRKINATIKAIIADKAKNFRLGSYSDIKPNQSRIYRSNGSHYVIGMANAIRNTVVASYTVGSGEIYIVFPANYPGWNLADPYTRFRVAIRDEIVYRSGLVSVDSRRSFPLKPHSH